MSSSPGSAFSRSDFYEEGAEGEGIVTGFATIGGNPVYIAAQNFEVLHGGVSAANCAKLLRCLALAEKNSTPVVYVLHSLGVQIGEGVTALEGFASVLSKAAKTARRRSAVCRDRRRSIRAQRAACGVCRFHFLYERRRSGGGQPARALGKERGKISLRKKSAGQKRSGRRIWFRSLPVPMRRCARRSRRSSA